MAELEVLDEVQAEVEYLDSVQLEELRGTIVTLVSLWRVMKGTHDVGQRETRDDVAGDEFDDEVDRDLQAGRQRHSKSMRMPRRTGYVVTAKMKPAGTR